MIQNKQPGASHSQASPPDSLLPARRVWERYGTTSRTLDRWLAREDLAFPKALMINGRRYWHESELIAWERARTVARVEVA